MLLADFRYEGIMLVHKGSDIKSLKDLQGKKSCHTGYGRNVGYKIPITKLRKHGVLKLSKDSSLASIEKELKGLSELFTESCLVGNYSSNDDLNRSLSMWDSTFGWRWTSDIYLFYSIEKRYSNLCALCEEPFKCNYPDKYSGYDGAIRCLVEKGGDVAFTKVIYVRRYFGVSTKCILQNVYVFIYHSFWVIYYSTWFWFLFKNRLSLNFLATSK